MNGCRGKIRGGLVALILAGLLSLLPASADGAPAIAVGEPFPGIVLPALEHGRPLSIRDFRGKKLMLHVFASW